MSKKLKWALLSLLILFSVIVVVYFVMRVNTKSYSPEDTVTFVQDELQLEVFYNRPYKKGREIFGGLVPYGEVWRTGANEATTFETSRDILVDGSLLPAGKYTLWTIPMEKSWKIIFNSKMYDWGITMEGEPSREPEFDVLTLERPVNSTYNSIEQFSIYFEKTNGLILMMLGWDRTVVAVPIVSISSEEENL